MVNMPEQVMESINAADEVAFATVDDNGQPNVIPVTFCKIKDPSTILLGDNFFKKTFANVQKPDSKVALCTWVRYKGYQVKGVANYTTEGPDYEAIKAMMKDNMPRKGCVVIKVTEVYDLTPKPGSAGNKIA